MTNDGYPDVKDTWEGITSQERVTITKRELTPLGTFVRFKPLEGGATQELFLSVFMKEFKFYC